MLRHKCAEADPGQSVFSCPLTLPAKYLTDEQTGDGTKRIGTASQQESLFERHAQHPLPNRHVGDYVIYEMSGAIAHAPRVATRTCPSAFARERNQNAASTVFADGFGETMLQQTAC